MTCIAGIIENDIVYIGGDSAGISGLSISVRADEKVFINGPFIMGFTTSFRMGQLLRYKLKVPKHKRGYSDMKYMVTDFIDSIRKCFSNNDFGSKDTGGRFLVGYNKKLYVIDNDFQVGIPTLSYHAVGAGADLALGAIHALKNKKPEERIAAGLQAASDHNAAVLPPFVILKQ